MIDPIKHAVEMYQCPGCTLGHDFSCYEKDYSEECMNHKAGTFSPISRVFLGMPTGFNILGPVKNQKINIFKKLDNGWKYDKLNIPVWKFLDSNNNTLVRGISPRINLPFIHIFIGNFISEINCIEITEKDIKSMN